MADPFSIASGLVGIVGVAIQVTQVVVGFIAQWKDVPKDTNNFMLELLALKTHLSELYTNLVLNPLFAIAFKDQDSTLMSKLGPDAMSMPDAELFLRTYIREMEALAKELQKRARGSYLGYERLKAAFNAVDTQKTIDKLQRYCEILNRMVSIDTALLGAITSTEIRAARNEQKEWQGLEESQRILGWLSQLDFQDRQRYLFSRRYPGTAEWLIKSDNFKSWRDGVNDKPQNLWCPGIPGAGKSVMTATVVDHLFSYFDEENVGIAYIFCDYKEK